MIFKKPKFNINNKFIFENLDKYSVSAFHKLKQSNIYLKKEEISLFYPGCGCDILRPLLLLESFCEFKKANIFFADFFLSPQTFAENFSAITNLNKFKKTKNSHKFKFKDKEFNFFYFECDVLLKQTFPNFDIYFERAFQLFRKDSLDFIPNIVKNLNKGGFFVSDFVDFKKKSLKIIKIPEEIKNIGFYKNFAVLKKII